MMADDPRFSVASATSNGRVGHRRFGGRARCFVGDRPAKGLAFCARARGVARRLVLATRRRSFDDQGPLCRRSNVSGVGERCHLVKRGDQPLDPCRRRRERDQVEGSRWARSRRPLVRRDGHYRCCRADARTDRGDRLSRAFMPQDGQSLNTFRGPAAAPWPEHVAPPVPAATFRVNAKDAAWVDSKMTPHPGEMLH